MFIDLIIKNDDNKKIEIKLRLGNQLKSEKDEFSSIELSIKNKLIINANYNDINHYHDLLMNNESIIIWRKNYQNVNKSLNQFQRMQMLYIYNW